MSRVTKVSRVVTKVEPQHWMDGGETACGLAIRTVRHYTAFWGCVTCPGCCTELQRRAAVEPLTNGQRRPAAVNPARVFDGHGKTTSDRFADLLLTLQDERSPS